MAAFTPVLDDLDAALASDLFARILARLRDLKTALRTEARACFAEFVADVSRLDSWKGASAASSVRWLAVGFRELAQERCGQACDGRAQPTKGRKEESAAIKRRGLERRLLLRTP